MTIAVGEVIDSVFDGQRLMSEEWIDSIRTMVVHAGGSTHATQRKLRRFVWSKAGSDVAAELSPGWRRGDGRLQNWRGSYLAVVVLFFDFGVPGGISRE